eukprot:286486_1
MHVRLNILYLLSIIWISVCAVISICISVGAVYHLYIKDSSSWINKTFRNLTAGVILIFTLCIIGDNIRTIVRFLNFSNRFEYDITERCIDATIDAIYYFGSITFYILLFKRISGTFGVTKNKCTISILTFLICIFTLSSIIACLVDLVPDSPPKFYYIKIILTILSITDFILNT